MKRKLFLTTILTVAVLFTACGGSDSKVIESDGTATNNAANASVTEAKGYVFTANGVDMAADMDAAPIVEALGEPEEYFEAPSCAGEGIGKLYTYADFEVQTYPVDGKDLVLYVLLKTDNVATAEGIDLSKSRDDIISTYGDPTKDNGDSLIYEKDGMKLIFFMDGDSIKNIEYDSAKN